MKSLAGFFIWFIALPGFAEHYPGLRNDPFARMENKVEVVVEGEVVTQVFEAKETRTLPVLKLIMVGKDVAMVNVEGKLLRPGEEYKGYRLHHVTSTAAVFTMEGKEFTMTLNTNRGLQDENSAVD